MREGGCNTKLHDPTEIWTSIYFDESPFISKWHLSGSVNYVSAETNPYTPMQDDMTPLQGYSNSPQKPWHVQTVVSKVAIFLPAIITGLGDSGQLHWFVQGSIHISSGNRITQQIIRRQVKGHWPQNQHTSHPCHDPGPSSVYEELPPIWRNTILVYRGRINKTASILAGYLPRIPTSLSCGVDRWSSLGWGNLPPHPDPHIPFLINNAQNYIDACTKTL